MTSILFLGLCILCLGRNEVRTRHRLLMTYLLLMNIVSHWSLKVRSRSLYDKVDASTASIMGEVTWKELQIYASYR